MPLTNTFSIPNISRCLKFACDTPTKVIECATVTSTFREAIIDFKQAEVLLNNVKDKITSKNKENEKSQPDFLQKVCLSASLSSWVLRIIIDDAEHLHHPYLETESILSTAIWNTNTEATSLLLDFVIDANNQHRVLSEKLATSFHRYLDGGRPPRMFSEPIDESTFNHWKMVFEKIKIIDDTIVSDPDDKLLPEITTYYELVRGVFKCSGPSRLKLRDLLFNIFETELTERRYATVLRDGEGLLAAMNNGDKEDIEFWLDKIDALQAKKPQDEQGTEGILFRTMNELSQCPGGSWYNILDHEKDKKQIEIKEEILKDIFERFDKNKILLAAVSTIDHLDYSPFTHFLCKSPKLLQMFLDQVTKCIMSFTSAGGTIDPNTTFPESSRSAAAQNDYDAEPDDSDDDDYWYDYFEDAASRDPDPDSIAGFLQRIIDATRSIVSSRFGSKLECMKILVDFFASHNASKQFVFGEVTRNCVETAKVDHYMLVAVAESDCEPETAVHLAKLILAQLESEEECARLIKCIKRHDCWGGINKGIEKLLSLPPNEILNKK